MSRPTASAIVMLRPALRESSALPPIDEIDESGATEAGFHPTGKRTRLESSESIDASASTQASPLVAADLAAMAEDLGILSLPPSALAVGAKLITTTHSSELPAGAVDITEAVVYEQHAQWQKKLRMTLKGSQDNKTLFILTQALEGGPKKTLRAVMSLSPAQVELLPERAREIINTTQSRVLERMRKLSAGLPAPRRYEITSQP